MRAEAFQAVRSLTEQLAAPLSAEDQAIQSMPDASPTKWHRAHTTWFFETFVLKPYVANYRPCNADYDFLFNSYYEAVGDRHPRHQRGLLSRPGAEEVGDYRTHVDAAVGEMVSNGGVSDEVVDLIELGLHHEQQHQELLLMDIKHVLASNPLRPSYATRCAPGQGRDRGSGDASELGWRSIDGGVVEVGHDGSDFAYDNESPRHEALVRPFRIADRLVTSGEWIDFIHDGGYRRPELWMSEGWSIVGSSGWEAPLYWERLDGEWSVARLDGFGPVLASEPVSHVSWFEADAFARWAGARLPTETEWEVASATPVPGACLALDRLGPSPSCESADPEQWHGELWQWTESSYRPYPGFRPAAGAVGEYNGKFMINQQVLRGSSCATPPGHARRTYRNFFSPASRWMFSGVRLAGD